MGTIQSCQGGKGHSYEYPTVDFLGNGAEMFLALSIAINHELPVRQISQVWTIENKRMIEPIWRMEFHFPK